MACLVITYLKYQQVLSLFQVLGFVLSLQQNKKSAKHVLNSTCIFCLWVGFHWYCQTSVVSAKVGNKTPENIWTGIIVCSVSIAWNLHVLPAPFPGRLLDMGQSWSDEPSWPVAKMIPVVPSNIPQEVMTCLQWEVFFGSYLFYDFRCFNKLNNKRVCNVSWRKTNWIWGWESVEGQLLTLEEAPHLFGNCEQFC